MRSPRSMILMTAIAVVFAAATATGQSEKPFEVVAPFDAAAEHLPEGLSIDAQGDMYVTLGLPFFVKAGAGWIRKVAADGSVTELATFSDGAPAGIVVGPEGEIYFARPNPGIPASRGVYRLLDDGSSELLPGTAEMLVANGLALDGRGSLYASDSALGTIWRIPLDGTAAEPWFSDQSLVGGCGAADELGANGIALWDGHLYAAVTSRGLLVRIPILEDGTAGPGEVVAGDDSNECVPDALFGMDGIAFDADGVVYALLVLQNQLVKIDPESGTVEVLLTAEDGLHNPASLAFGTVEGDRSSLYIANYAVLPPVPEDSPGPAILKYDAGVEGLMLP